ncbi:DUF2332 family protein [Alteribacillus sp. HJP-4]
MSKKIAEDDEILEICSLLLELLTDIVETLPKNTAICIFHTHVANKIPEDLKYDLLNKIKTIGSKRDVFHLYNNMWDSNLHLDYFIIEASNELASSNEDLIRLPRELKQVEEQMNQIKQSSIKNDRLAKEAEQRKNDLIVYLAHDLKTPLTSVIGYLTLLNDEQEISNELRQKYTSISLDKAIRLEDLINEFFEITRFNLSKLTLELSQVNVIRMFEQLTFEFQPLLNEKKLAFQLISPDKLDIKCDVGKMERVFDNIIRNAVSYSFPDSTITIEIKEESKGISIRFENEGYTIPEEKVNRIFEQFYRLDSSRGTNTGGAGLGLAIAKEIVELHQGTISVSSSDDKVVFIIYLPTLS